MSARGALPCGADLDDLAAQVAGEHPGGDPAVQAHQRVCPHCRAALAEQAELDAALRELAAETPGTPPGLGGRVMERVGSMAVHGWHAVVPEPAGTTRIAAWVVAVVARRAAAAVDGVGDVVGRAVPPLAALVAVRAQYAGAGPTAEQRSGALGVGVAGRKVVVTVRLTARAGLPLPGLAQQVRRSVVDAVRELTGLEVVEVDVHVADLEE